MPKKRRVSKETRAKISRGLKRYHRAERVAARRRSLAAKRAAVTRKANRELRRIQQVKKVTPVKAPPAAATEVEEWEVTVKYTVKGHGKHHGEVVDVTLRLIGRPGERWENAKVRAAAWYAMRHGADSLNEFSLAVMNWRNTARSGHERVNTDYTGSDLEAALENARGIFNAVGMGGLRVALVE